MQAVTATGIDVRLSSAESAAATFHVHKDVFTCMTNDALVFLDLRHDRYFALSIDCARTLSHLVTDWPIPNASQDVSDQDAGNLTHRLEQAGLLTRNPKLARMTQAASPNELPADLWMLDEPASSPRIRSSHLLTFARTCAETKWRLHGRSLAAAINHIRTKKMQIAAENTDLETVAAVVSVFRRLRVFAFATNGHCLYHALALVDFLAHYRISATLVIGVRTRPWAAHSWVQYGTALLDARPDHVHAYTAIHRA